MKNIAASFIVILLIGFLSACASLNLMKPAGQSGNRSSASSEDASITNRINSRFVHDARIPAFDIKVSTQSGIVILKGRVASVSIKNHAQDVASGVKGVKSVRNQLSIR